MAWSMFLKHKDNQYERLLLFLMQMKAYKTPVSHIRCDNSGKNNYFEQLVQKKGYNIIFEFYLPYIPQQNGRVERKFCNVILLHESFAATSSAS
jgi:hypothetical protein